MKNMKRLLAIALALVMVLALLPATALAASKPASTISESGSALTKGFKSEAFIKGNTYQYSDSEIVRAIIIMDGEPAAMAGTGTKAAAITRLTNQHKTLRNSMSAQKISYTVNFDYSTLLNGMSVSVAYGELEKIAAMEGVSAVHIANTYTLPDDEINMDSSNGMTGISLLQEYGYIGSGTVIAVLDTGLNVNHEAFQVYDGMLESAAISAADADPATYVSQKIPYAYDYADGDNDVSDKDGHGTHVCGIATGYVQEADGAISFSGSAPDAQLLAMKVFPDAESTTSSDIYFAALEDAYELGADVINMSLGSAGGFTYDAELETEEFGDIYSFLDAHGVLCVISAGNEGSQADNTSNWAGGVVTNDYADYGVIGSPSTYAGNTSVASAVNERSHFYVATVETGTETLNIKYNDSSENDKLLDVYADTVGLQYVAIPGVGAESDFEGIDVTGKFALIQRGELDFTNKVLNAEAAGAVGVICYDHTDEDLMGMILEGTSIPAIFIGLNDGTALVELANGGAHDIAFPKGDIVMDNEDMWLMSDFSSWGCTNDLQLKPSITGIGTGVWSADATTTDGYISYNGTSMSSPDVAGCYAVLLSALREDYPQADNATLVEMVEDLAESTAYVLTDADGYSYSPRKQGSGLIAVDYALSSSAYISDPIKSLYDTEDGSFSFSFIVKNLFNEDVTYNLSADILCDYPVTINVGTEEEPDNRVYNSLTSDDLSEYGDYELTMPESITVPAGDQVTVDVTLQMSSGLIAALNDIYPNGSFIEGYITLINPDSYNETYGYYEENYLHTTFMGFNGDWTQAPIMETRDWRDIVDAETWLNTAEADEDGNTYADYGYTYLDAVDWEINTDVSMAYLANLTEGKIGCYAGDNAFFYNENEFSENRIAVTSPDSDSYYYDTLYMLPMQLRNARHLIMIVSDATTGEVYTVDDTEYLPKAIYNEDEAYWEGSGSFLFDGTKSYNVDDVTALPNGTKVDIDYYANLAYGEDALGEIDYEDLKTQGTDYLVWSFDATVDSEAPELLDYTYEEGLLTLKYTDNEYIAAIGVYDTDGNEIDSIGVEEDSSGATTEVSFEIGELAVVYVAAQDYATNESQDQLILAEIPATLTFHVPEGVTVDGGSTISGMVGETVTLPAVSGTAPAPYEFIAWVPAEIAAVSEVDGDYFFDGDDYMIEGDADFYALFVRDDGYYDPTVEVDIVMAAADDWTGTYAIDGYDWNTDDDYVLSDDGSAINCYENEIDVEYYFGGYAYMYDAPETALFDFAKLDDGSYTIRSKSTGRYLIYSEGGVDFAETVTDLAKWTVDYDDDLSVNIIASVSAPGKWLVFDTTDLLFKAVDASINDFDEPYNLYLFGPAEKYLYTTNPQPCTHSWQADAENTLAPTCTVDGYNGFVCTICGETKSEAVTALGHSWDDGVVTTAPTVEAEGVKTYTCARCGETKTEPIAKLTLTFTDVPKTAFYAAAVDWAVANGITKGTSDTTFSPKDPCTRAQVVTFLWRAAGEPTPTKTDCPFTDVKQGTSYYTAMLWAIEEGITKGTSDTTFSPNEGCTRGQVVTFLWRYENEPAPKTTANPFKDVKTGSFFYNAVLWAVENEITKGATATTFAPASICTRGEIVTFLYRDLGNK